MNKTAWISRHNHEANQLLPEPTNTEDHVIVCGYGPTGSIVVKKLKDLNVNTVVVDLNYRAIQTLKANKQSAVYGDSASMIVMEAAGIEKASLMVVTIPDPMGIQSLLKKVKKHYPKLPIIVRVKYQSDRDKMIALGADEVVWEEMESGLVLAQKAAARIGID